MVSVSNINFQYNGSTGDNSVGKQAGELAKQVVQDTIINALIGAGGAKEIANTGVRETKTVADQASSITSISTQQQIATNAIQTITQMVQTGQVDISNFQNLLTQVITEITDNNTKAEAMEEQIENLNNENKSIKSELESLNNGTLEGLEIVDYLKTNSSDDSNETTDNKRGSTLKRAGTNPNQSKIEKLLEKLNLNNQIIGTLKNSIVNISQQQTSFTAQGKDIQQKSEEKHANITANIQNFAQESFSKFTNSLNSAIQNGITTQQSHSAEGLSCESSDSATAAALTAKAAGSGLLGAIGGFFTAGISTIIGSATAANATKEAALFTTAAGMNGALSGTALANQGVLKQVGDQLGNVVAQNLTSYVNTQLQGVITEMTNTILGEDIASKVSPKIMEYIQNKGVEES